MKKMIMGVVCLLILCVPFAGVSDETENRGTLIRQTEWSWGNGNLSQFEGVLLLPESCPDPAKIKLTILPDPSMDDNGPIVFTHVDGKRLTVKKQSDEVTIHPGKLKGEIRFQGSWTIPENGYYNGAVIVLTLMSENGEKLEEHSFSFRNDLGGALENGEGMISLRTDQMILWLALAAGAIWIAAAIRIILNHRRRRA